MPIKRTLALLTLTVTWAASAPAASQPGDPLYVYYWNSIVCQNQKTKAVCHLWLNQDRTYLLTYDLGVQDKPLEVSGPYRLEAWEGTYTLKGREVCLQPEPSPRGKVFVSRERGELFAQPGCYAVGPHNIGDIWMQADRAGNAVKIWLLSNR